MTWTPRAIIELRDRHGWTQQDLADHIDKSLRIVQVWEKPGPKGELDIPCKMSRSSSVALDRIATQHQASIQVADLVSNIHRVPTGSLFAEAVRRLMAGVELMPDHPEPLPDEVIVLGALDFDPHTGEAESEDTAT